LKIQATPTFRYIPLIPCFLVILTAIIMVPILGVEGLWIAAAVALFSGIQYVNYQSNRQKLHFDYRSLDWLLYGDIHMVERMLNIAESENRRAIVTYSKNLSLKGFKDCLSALALRNLCRRRLIEVDLVTKPAYRLDLSLDAPKGYLLVQGKNERDLNYRLEKLVRRGWERDEDQSGAIQKLSVAMKLPVQPSREVQIKQAVEGQAIVWFEDRTIATVRLTNGPMPSQGLPAEKLPAQLDVVSIKKYPGTHLIASVRLKNFTFEYSENLRQVAEENGTVAWIKGEPRDIAAWLKGRHTLDGETIEDTE